MLDWCLLMSNSIGGGGSQALSGTRQSGLDRSNWNPERAGGILLAQASPITERHDLLVFDSQIAQDVEDPTHRHGIVNPLTQLGLELRYVLAFRELRQQTPVAATGPFRVTQTVVRDGQEPRQDGRSAQSNVLPLPPRLEEDDAREIFGQVPIARPSEAVVVDRGRVTVEEIAKRRAVVGDGSLPQFGVGQTLTPHIPTMSGTTALVPFALSDKSRAAVPTATDRSGSLLHPPHVSWWTWLL
jgi:hypothetical protein